MDLFNSITVRIVRPGICPGQLDQWLMMPGMAPSKQNWGRNRYGPDPNPNGGYSN